MKEKFKINNNLRMTKYTLNKEELYEFLETMGLMDLILI